MNMIHIDSNNNISNHKINNHNKFNDYDDEKLFESDIIMAISEFCHNHKNINENNTINNDYKDSNDDNNNDMNMNLMNIMISLLSTSSLRSLKLSTPLTITAASSTKSTKTTQTSNKILSNISKNHSSILNLKSMNLIFTSTISILLTVIFLLSIIQNVNGQDQQSQAICHAYFEKFSKKHTTCLKPNRYCMIKEQGLNKNDQKLILDVHNYYRNLIASGNESNLGFPSAANMLTLQWDDELAYVAQKHADQCRFEHDCYDCRRTEHHPVVGQNLYIYRTTRTKVKPDWRKVIREWYEEIKIAPPQVAFSFDLFQLNIGHFTQIAWADTNRIGCGFSSYNDYDNPGSIFKTVHLYTCNYAPGGNYKGEKMYENGAPLSKCPPQYGQSKQFKALCELIDNFESNLESFASFDANNNQIDYNQPIENPSTSVSITNNNDNQYSTVYNHIEPSSTQRTTTTRYRTITSSTRRKQNNNNRRVSTTTTTTTTNRQRTYSNKRNRNGNRRKNYNNNRNNQQWDSRLNNWKNNSTTTSTVISTIIPSTQSSLSSWKWNQSGYDFNKWLTNYTTFTNWTTWESKPKKRQGSRTIVTTTTSTNIDNNNNNIDPTANSLMNFIQNQNPQWRLTNVTWWSNSGSNNNNDQPITVTNANGNRITTRLPSYTWALSFGLQRGDENKIPNQQSYSWSRSIDLTPNNMNNNQLDYRYSNRYEYYN